MDDLQALDHLAAASILYAGLAALGTSLMFLALIYTFKLSGTNKIKLSTLCLRFALNELFGHVFFAFLVVALSTTTTLDSLTIWLYGKSLSWLISCIVWPLEIWKINKAVKSLASVQDTEKLQHDYENNDPYMQSNV